MKAKSILNKTLTLVTPNMHGHRRNALVVAVQSLISGSAATVTSLGRGLASNSKEKHKIKRADRLLSNKTLHTETFSVYQALANFTVGNCKRPIILVDWSDLDEYRRHFLIRATLASHGRGLCVYEEVHDAKTKEKRKTHTKFLFKLAELLPLDCKPIIVTDAGFKAPWFRSVLAMGWDFVGRARIPNLYATGVDNWQCVSTLHAKATSCPKSFSVQMPRYDPLHCQLVVYKQDNKGRHSYNRRGQLQRTTTAMNNRRSAREPWVLATSLPQGNQLAKRVVKIYRMRMQIEEGFRDMKSRRFGLGFEYNKTTHLNRLSILIFLTTLAHWVLMIFGMMAKLENKHRQYQANSIKSDTVLSLAFIGRRVAADQRFVFKIRSCLLAIRQLQICSDGVGYELL